MPDPSVIFVLGGARSGKSAYAERLARAHADAHGTRPVYVATAQAGDAEMAARIEDHRARRGEAFETIEAPLDLPAAILRQAGEGAIVLVDCLTLWLSNILMAERDAEAAAAALEQSLGMARGPLIVVSNEVGLGLVPETPLGRTFRDSAGRLNQRVAGRAETVILMAAGLPLVLKGSDPMQGDTP